MFIKIPVWFIHSCGGIYLYMDFSHAFLNVNFKLMYLLRTSFHFFLGLFPVKNCNTCQSCLKFISSFAWGIYFGLHEVSSFSKLYCYVL